MINPRSMAVLIRNDAASPYEDKTRKVSYTQAAGQRIEIVFTDSNECFRFGWDRVAILRHPKRHELTEGEQVEINGTIWERAIEVLTFTGTEGAWSRIFYRTQAGEKYSTYPASRVRVITSATETPRVASVLNYWRSVVFRLRRDDPLRPHCPKVSGVIGPGVWFWRAGHGLAAC